MILLLIGCGILLCGGVAVAVLTGSAGVIAFLAVLVGFSALAVVAMVALLAFAPGPLRPRAAQPTALGPPPMVAEHGLLPRRAAVSAAGPVAIHRLGVGITPR